MVCIIQPLSFVYTIINKLKLISIITVMSGAVNVIAMILLILNGLENGYVVVGTTAFINIILIWLHPCLVKKYLGLKDEFFFRIVVRHVIVFFVVTMIFFCLFRNIVFESLAVFFVYGVILLVLSTFITTAIILGKHEKKWLINKIKNIILRKNGESAL